MDKAEHSNYFAEDLEWKKPEEILLHQEHKLRELIQYITKKSSFYRDHFSNNGLSFDRVNRVADLALVPPVTKDDLQEHNPGFLCVGEKDIREHMCTSGTSGAPVTISLTENDLNRLAYNEYRSFITAGCKSGDKFQLILTLDRQFMAGSAYYAGIRRLGGISIRTGPGLAKMQWDSIMRYKPEILIVVPSFLLKLIEYAQQNNIDFRSTAVKKAICIGENVRGADLRLNALGNKITGVWPIQLISTYASTEKQTAFTECEYGMGGHVRPELIIAEILDDSGAPVAGDAPGELVVTTLDIEGMPMLRYRTGDICRMYHEPCPCGRNTPRISPVLGRKNQMIKYKGTTMFPPAVFEVLNKIDYVAEYILEVFKDQHGNDDLLIHVATRSDHRFVDQEIKAELRSGLRVLPSVHYLPYQEILKMQFPENSRKPVKFIDNRK